MDPRRPLAIALTLALAAAVDSAAAADPRSHERELPAITVTATPLAEPGDELVQPAAVLAGAALEQQRAPTIGQSVEQLSGVQSSYFGPGVGRPIIRGLDGARVSVLANGSAVQDVSTLSVDHAVAIEPFLADQIEVLKGPATLLYGSSAIGGIVNVVDGRIAREAVDGLDGRVDLGRGTVNDATHGLVRLDGGNGTLHVHADYARRDGRDFDAPGGGRIANSAVDGATRALGASLIGEAGRVGIAWTRFDSTYGIPLVEDDDDLLAVGFDAKRRAAPRSPDLAKGGEDKAVVLDMEQERVDLEAVLNAPLPGVQRLRLRGARSDYRHVELEIEDGDREVGTVFDNDARDARLEAVLAPWAGWTTALGVQSVDREFAAAGEEAFVPPSRTRERGLYAVAQRSADRWTTEAGLRFEEQDTEALGFARRAHRPFSLSAGLLYAFAEDWHLTLNLDRAERAPQAEELYSDGPHAATASYEIGDPALGEERANQLELGLHWHAEGIEAKASAYVNRFEDFIYLAATGAEEDDLPVRQWTQADARFVGAEAEIKARLAESDLGRFDLRVYADRVRGRLEDGGNLPRIVPARFGAGLSWERGGWRANLAGIRHAPQDRIAAFESPTAGYTLVNAHLSWGFVAGPAEWELYVDATNLGDREAFVHTSFLKDRAPLPGRGILFGLRSWF